MKDNRQEQAAEVLLILLVIAAFLLFIQEARSQSFDFQLSGGIAEIENTDQGASLFYAIGVGFTSKARIGVILKGSRAFFINSNTTDSYTGLATYKAIDSKPYDLVVMAGGSYVRSPFYLNNWQSDSEGYGSPTFGLQNLIAVGDLIDIMISLEMNTAKKLTTYVGLGLKVNLVFQTESRTKRFY